NKSMTIWTEPEHEEWANLSERTKTFIHRLTDNPEITVKVTPDIRSAEQVEEEGKYPAGSFYHGPKVIRLDAGQVLPRSMERTDVVDPASVLSQRRFPSFIGVCVHESGHANYTAAKRVTKNPFLSQWVKVMEEIRIESKMLTRFPHYDTYIKSVLIHVLNFHSFASSFDDAEIEEVKKRYDVGRMATLSLGRVLIEVIEPEEAKPIEDLVISVLGEDGLDALRKIWAEFIELDSTDRKQMRKLARDFQSVIDPDDVLPTAYRENLKKQREAIKEMLKRANETPCDRPSLKTPPTPNQQNQDNPENSDNQKGDSGDASDSGQPSSSADGSGQPSESSDQPAPAEGAPQNGFSDEINITFGDHDNDHDDDDDDDDWDDFDLDDDSESDFDAEKGKSGNGSDESEDDKAGDSSKGETKDGETGDSSKGDTEGDESGDSSEDEETGSTGDKTDSSSSSTGEGNGSNSDSGRKENDSESKVGSANNESNDNSSSDSKGEDEVGANTRLSAQDMSEIMREAVIKMAEISRNAQQEISTGFKPSTLPVPDAKDINKDAQLRAEQQVAQSSVFGLHDRNAEDKKPTDVESAWKRHQREREENKNPFGTVISMRKPKPEDYARSRAITVALQKAQYREVHKTTLNSTMPPGRFNVRQAMNRTSQVAAGQDVTATPWKQTRRREVDNPPITLAVATDVSRSMNAWQREVSSFTWAFSHAVKGLRGKAGAVAWNTGSTALIQPNVAVKDIPVAMADGGSTGCPSAMMALDSLMDLSFGSGVRVLAIITDGYLTGRGFTNNPCPKTQGVINQLHSRGVKVMWFCTRPDGWIPKNTTSAILNQPEDFGRMVGKTVIDTLSKA
ncbi:MAG: hypothetical protein H9W81_05080, partial [Enterococcus sp.]|nr:hypothetical protein [Enterococcus sp.]